MRAEVLVPRSSRRPGWRAGLYTYDVPEQVAAAVQPGQLVAVPFGEREVVGIVWALDAGAELADAEDIEPHGRSTVPLRALRGILQSEPLLSPLRRSLAEWLADHYAVPLDVAVQLLLPPGLLRGVRAVVRPRSNADEAGGIGAPAPGGVPGDVAAVLALLRERGWLERETVERTLGRERAFAALGELVAAGQASVSVELLDAQLRVRRERVVRLSGAPEEIEVWRAAARARLDALPASGSRVPRRPATREERQAERILRQLAVLDVLARAPRAPRAPETGQTEWRVEELRRLTRATERALDELIASGLICIEEVDVRHDPLAGRAIAHSVPHALTPAQTAALAAILAPTPSPSAGAPDASRGDTGHVVLLHGITGSGKTEVYLQALAATLAQGRRGIVLVPEIALTPQAVARFAGRFPGRVALLHSGLTDAERLDEWRRIRAGQVDIVVGSRSAIFAPVERLGLVIVDEEHEVAYKQDRTPSYHARDVAVRLGALTGATVVLGSATPSVEAYWLATTGAYRLVELRERAPAGAAEAASLPPVTLVDLRAELRSGNTSILSETLRTALRETIDRGEQAILFLNRRGMASSLVCRECGYALRCSHCDVSMTFHASERAVICHYCGKREAVPQTCPVCWSASIRYFGVGTERVEAAVKRYFSAARVLRWDRDTARTRQAHEELLHAFAERRADVLVGTQMIAKGLDLPGVTLVGVVSADVALLLPDFRASERAFQLLTQVAGRAGRGSVPGRVIVQTFNPEHFCIQAAARHDYHAFFEAEVVGRRRYGYPPFRRFVKCTFEHADRYTAQIEATALAARLEQLIQQQGLNETDLVGPAPAFLERLRGRYRWQLIIRSPDPRRLLHALSADGMPFGWSVDVDPASSL